jgi:peptide/nickel transport system substrate-binding protein
MPKDYIDQHGMDYFLQHPIGSGPYKFLRHVAGDMVEFEALDKHWRAGTVAFKTLTTIKMPEETTRVAAFKTGELDAIEGSLDTSAELEALGYKTLATGQVLGSIEYTGALDPRNAGNPTADVRVRQALSMAINREEIRNNFFFGKARPPMPIPLKDTAADVDTAYWLDYAKNLLRYDPEGAKQLLKEAGYPNGFSLKIYSYVGSGHPWENEMAQILQGYWLKIGVNAQIIVTDQGSWGKLNIAMPDKSPALELVGTVHNTASEARAMVPTQLEGKWLSGQTTGVGGGSLTKTIPGLDELIKSLWSESDANKRKDTIAKIIKQAADSYIATPTAIVPMVASIGNRVKIDLPPENTLQHMVAYVEFMKHNQ